MRVPTHAATSPAGADAAGDALSDLEVAVQAVTLALRGGDARALQAAAQQLQARLQPALQSVSHGAVGDRAAQRRTHAKLAGAAAELAAQREAVARASAAIERATSVLLPRAAEAYDASGAGVRPMSTGSFVA